MNRQGIRRALGQALVLALCAAALTAIVAVLDGDFNDTDGRIIGMSLGFGVYSALGASGAALRLRENHALRHLGLATIALSLVGFALLLSALWIEDGYDGWAVWGCVSLAALAASHASLVLGARRDGDSDGIRLLSSASVALATIDAWIGILAIAGATEEVADGSAQVIAVLVILLILTTALPPILRRMGGGAEPPATKTFTRELLAAADRIEALNGNPQIRRECERLRRLARDHGR